MKAERIKFNNEIKNVEEKYKIQEFLTIKKGKLNILIFDKKTPVNLQSS